MLVCSYAQSPDLGHTKSLAELLAEREARPRQAVTLPPIGVESRGGAPGRPIAGQGSSAGELGPGSYTSSERLVRRSASAPSFGRSKAPRFQAARKPAGEGAAPAPARRGGGRRSVVTFAEPEQPEPEPPAFATRAGLSCLPADSALASPRVTARGEPADFAAAAAGNPRARSGIHPRRRLPGRGKKGSGTPAVAAGAEAPMFLLGGPSASPLRKAF